MKQAGSRASRGTVYSRWQARAVGQDFWDGAVSGQGDDALKETAAYRVLLEAFMKQELVFSADFHMPSTHRILRR